MPDRENYIENLKWRLSQLKEEIVARQNEIQDLFKQIEVDQEQIKNITHLLAAEGMQLNDPDLAAITEAPIADLAYEFLKKDPDHKPYHYSEIAKGIMSQGVLIPGKNPSANLLTHISRDDRFIRTSSGMYGLVEDGHKPSPKSKRRKKQR